MKEQAVLRVPRTDDDAAYVLIQVTSKGKKGLSFDLAATDGSWPYVGEGTCRRARPWCRWRPRAQAVPRPPVTGSDGVPATCTKYAQSAAEN